MCLVSLEENVVADAPLNVGIGRLRTHVLVDVAGPLLLHRRPIRGSSRLLVVQQHDREHLRRHVIGDLVRVVVAEDRLTARLVLGLGPHGLLLLVPVECEQLLARLVVDDAHKVAHDVHDELVHRERGIRLRREDLTASLFVHEAVDRAVDELTSERKERLPRVLPPDGRVGVPEAELQGDVLLCPPGLRRRRLLLRNPLRGLVNRAEALEHQLVQAEEAVPRVIPKEHVHGRLSGHQRAVDVPDNVDRLQSHKPGRRGRRRRGLLAFLLCTLRLDSDRHLRSRCRTRRCVPTRRLLLILRRARVLHDNVPLGRAGSVRVLGSRGGRRSRVRLRDFLAARAHSPVALAAGRRSRSLVLAAEFLLGESSGADAVKFGDERREYLLDALAISRRQRARGVQAVVDEIGDNREEVRRLADR
eukprot:Opistho-1_new@89177